MVALQEFFYNCLSHLRRFIEGNRILFSLLTGIFFIYFSRPAFNTILTGIPVIIAGEALRVWASGYIKKDAELATEGPYALTRNPLYLGNFLIGAGFSIMANNLWLAIIFLIIFYLVYSVTIKREEKYLLSKFGRTYREYKNNVPAFFPVKLSPILRSGRNNSFSWKLVHKHREYNTWLGITGCLIIFILKSVYG